MFAMVGKTGSEGDRADNRCIKQRAPLLQGLRGPREASMLLQKDMKLAQEPWHHLLRAWITHGERCKNHVPPTMDDLVAGTVGQHLAKEPRITDVVTVPS